MYIAILGRQPKLGMAELESFYGAEHTAWFSDISATITTDLLSLETLGGSQKAGRIVLELPYGNWQKTSRTIVNHYHKKWSRHEGKITLGLSLYGFDFISARDVQKTGIILKKKLKETGVSLRLIPNATPALNTAVSHHNKLGLSANKVELLIIKNSKNHIIVAESTGAQNITSLAKRDQGRPKRDPFVGMLPPKLAQIMINLALPASRTLTTSFQQPLQPRLDFGSGAKSSLKTMRSKDDHTLTLPRLLDPFCGTGVVLQEAALRGYAVYGTDLNEKMIRYTHENLAWLQKTYNIRVNSSLHQGDAMTIHWQPPIDTIVCEAYLGQPFSAPPSPVKLAEVRRNCSHIITTFLKNIASQIKPGTPLCIAIPAWKDSEGNFSHLPLISHLKTLGFVQHPFTHLNSSDLLYYREDQIVARELLVLTKK